MTELAGGGFAGLGEFAVFANESDERQGGAGEAAVTAVVAEHSPFVVTQGRQEWLCHWSFMRGRVRGVSVLAGL
jgi:hypothetical protein